MSEENRAPFILSDHFDARLLSLYSRRVQDGLPRNFLGPDRSYSFCYYDAIEVEYVELKDGPVLKDAYTQAQRKRGSRTDEEERRDLGFRQTLVALTDLKDGTDGHGYTKGEVEAFWSSERSAPLFFVSMLNLAATRDLDGVLSEIRDKFPPGRHLAYITFDHCDIIIFCQGDSFQEYARCIFDLYYAGKTGLGDAITLYSFTGGIPSTNGERFAALVRVGVTDYPSRERFYQKLRRSGNLEGAREDERLRKYWLLVRSVKKSNPGSGVWLLFCVWGFAGIAGGRFIIKAGESFGCVQHVNIGNLFAAADIVKHDNPIVIQVHGIYKRVDNPPPKFHVEQVPLAERFQPYDNIRFSVADFVCNAQL